MATQRRSDRLGLLLWLNTAARLRARLAETLMLSLVGSAKRSISVSSGLTVHLFASHTTHDLRMWGGHSAAPR